MSGISRVVDATDRFQRRRAWLAVPVATLKKFQDDQAARLAALISYYGFAAFFALLLVLITVLDITMRNNPELRQDLVNSALSQYPVIGQQIKGQLGSIAATGTPLAFGIILLLFSARGVAMAMQNALCEIWGISRASRPGFLWSQLYALALILVVAAGLVLTTFLSGLVGGAGHVLAGMLEHTGAVVVSLLLNFGVFWLGFRLATMRRVRWHDLRKGAAFAAVVWQVLQVVGGYVVSHQLQRSSELYGTFGVVLGLMAWLYLQAMVTLYAAEVDVVLVRQLWPRSLVFDNGEPAHQDEKAGMTRL
jgi:membrane protein